MQNVKMDLISKLSNLGAELSDPLTPRPDRMKAQGRMWTDNTSLLLRNIEFCFVLWHHGNEHETSDSLRKEYSLKSIVYNGKYYDAGWHAIQSTKGIYLSTSGWFSDRDLANKLIVKFN